MLERLLHYAAIACSLLVVTGWGWFAIDQTSAASQQSAAEIAGLQASQQPTPSSEQEAVREEQHGRVHELVDDANDILLAPFASVASSSTSTWARRSAPALLALVAYGFGFGLLARFAGSGR